MRCSKRDVENHEGRKLRQMRHESQPLVRRLRVGNLDRLIVVWLYRTVLTILSVITVVKPETVIRWHRRGFRALCLLKIPKVAGQPFQNLIGNGFIW
jgi:hypothetical protein